MNDLFSIAQSHSTTSINAAKKITDNGSRQTQKEKILAWMEYLSQDGANIRETANHFQIGMNIASGRIRELQEEGKIIKTGIERKAEGSQSEGSVYVVAHRYCDEMGLGFQKDAVHKKNYKLLRKCLEKYAQGINDNGVMARNLLHKLHPHFSSAMDAC